MKEKVFYYFGKKYSLTEYGDVTVCENTKIVKYNYSGRIVKKERTTKSKRMKPYQDKYGYLEIQLNNGSHTRHCKIHHLVYLVFIKNIVNIDDIKIGYDFNSKTFVQINHIDGNKQNNHYTNLELISLQDNIKHAVEHKLHNSQLSAKYIEIYKNGTYIDTIWKTREVTKYIKDNYNIAISCDVVSRCARSGKSCKGFSFKYKV